MEVAQSIRRGHICDDWIIYCCAKLLGTSKCLVAINVILMCICLRKYPSHVPFDIRPTNPQADIVATGAASTGSLRLI